MLRMNDGIYWTSAGVGQQAGYGKRWRYSVRYREEKITNVHGPVKVIVKDGKRVDALTAGQSGN